MAVDAFVGLVNAERLDMGALCCLIGAALLLLVAAAAALSRSSSSADCAPHDCGSFPLRGVGVVLSLSVLVPVALRLCPDIPAAGMGREGDAAGVWALLLLPGGLPRPRPARLDVASVFLDSSSSI